VDAEHSLAEQFENVRPHLRAVAGRMLGSAIEADDAVQDTWLRLRRNGAGDIRNLEGWLTTVIARVCLDMLRSRTSRLESRLEDDRSSPLSSSSADHDPEREVLVVDSIGFALLMVLESLSPQERVAFVLHDVFAVPFSEIAPIVGRSPEAARKLASRARRRVRGRADSESDRAADRQVVQAFLAAARSGDLNGLLELLDPEVIARADAEAVRLGASHETHGAENVAKQATTRRGAARLALVDGEFGAVWAPTGTPRVVLKFSMHEGRIIEIDISADRRRLSRLDLVMLGD
jgi:RNA polymerase sigma factor (sigma-70 family)